MLHVTVPVLIGQSRGQVDDYVTELVVPTSMAKPNGIRSWKPSATLAKKIETIASRAHAPDPMPRSLESIFMLASCTRCAIVSIFFGQGIVPTKGVAMPVNFEGAGQCKLWSRIRDIVWVSGSSVPVVARSGKVDALSFTSQHLDLPFHIIEVWPKRYCSSLGWIKTKIEKSAQNGSRQREFWRHILPWPKKLKQPRARGTGAWSVEHAHAYVWLVCLFQFFWPG